MLVDLSLVFDEQQLINSKLTKINSYEILKNKNACRSKTASRVVISICYTAANSKIKQIRSQEIF